ncbi:winged helix-turn-helix transcriptional regulator [Methanocella sp. MCL-LM]|uniref:winged helix-turn-helix transcriptional regulator n=1 Tax=Methanocella sp. MCL-LM TaxID=3412035 RepID=UPI003C72BCA1
MRLSLVITAVAIVVLSAITIFGVLTTTMAPPVTIGDSDGYVVTPATSGGSTGKTPVDAPLTSYWNLPLWVKVASALDGLLITIGLIGIAPSVIGRIQDVLDNSNRQAIFYYVLNNPGCTPAEITARQNMNNSTVKYHLLMLESEGKVSKRRMGKFTRFYNNAGVNDMEKVVASYLRNDTSKSILQVILDNPGITNNVLSERFSLDKSTVHWHMERFLKDGLVGFEQEGKYKKYFVKAEASTAFLKLGGHGPMSQPAVAASTAGKAS